MTHDVIVIGAGPAGLSAALTAASLGLKTALIDEQPRPGGQIYRNVAAADPKVAALLGPDYRHGQGLVNRLAGSGVDFMPGSLVWDVSPQLAVTVQRDGASTRLQCRELIIASGALERPSPVPGWTLPGVLNAGAAQIALKTAASIPNGPVVLAGAGPLLLLVACQLLQGGAQVAALIETSPRRNRAAALAHLLPALGYPAPLLKGARMIMQLRAARVPWFTAAEQLAIEGGERAASVSFVAGGRARRVAAAVVLLHHGVIPNTQLTRLLRVQHDWNEQQLAWQPRTGEWGETSARGIRIAGDGAAIDGALAAQASGALAALGAAHALGQLETGDRDRRALPWRSALRRQRLVRPFLDALYRPPEWINTPGDDTIVCRCEEVTAGRVREMARLGCQGPNQTKFFSRCGMGPCQGRLCGSTVTQVLAQELGRTPAEVGAYRVRPPLKPVTLASLAALAEANEGAAVRETIE